MGPTEINNRTTSAAVPFLGCVLPFEVSAIVNFADQKPSCLGAKRENKKPLHHCTSADRNRTYYELNTL